jgi:hypothetical protein
MIRLSSSEQSNPILLNPAHIIGVWRNGYNGSRIRTRDGQIFDVVESVDTLEKLLKGS